MAGKAKAVMPYGVIQKDSRRGFRVDPLDDVLTGKWTTPSAAGSARMIAGYERAG